MIFICLINYNIIKMSITRLQTQILSYENKINNIDSKIKTTTSIIRENKSKF